jgi:hypothetical protein
MKMVNLFLDDIRMPCDVAGYISNVLLKGFYCNTEFVIVRNYDEFVEFILKSGVPDFISFDHDLADEHYSPEMYSGPEVYNKNYEIFKEKTGFDCAKFLVEYCMDNDTTLPRFLVHSMNPTGKVNIESYLSNYVKFQNKR